MRELLRKLWFRTTVDGFDSSLYIAIEIFTKTIPFFWFLYTNITRYVLFDVAELVDLFLELGVLHAALLSWLFSLSKWVLESQFSGALPSDIEYRRLERSLFVVYLLLTVGTSTSDRTYFVDRSSVFTLWLSVICLYKEKNGRECPKNPKQTSLYRNQHQRKD